MGGHVVIRAPFLALRLKIQISAEDIHFPYQTSSLIRIRHLGKTYLGSLLPAKFVPDLRGVLTHHYSHL